MVLTAETWALRKTEELRLVIFERRVLRKMYGLQSSIAKLKNVEDYIIQTLLTISEAQYSKRDR